MAKDKKIISRFNPIDFAIIVILVASLIWVALRIAANSNLPESKDNSLYEVTFVCEKVRHTTMDSVQEGNAFYFYGTNTLLGSIKMNTLADQAATEDMVINGVSYTVVYPQDSLINIKGTLNVMGTRDGNGFLTVDGRIIVPNSVVKVSNQKADLEIRIIAIEEVNQNNQ